MFIGCLSKKYNFVLCFKHLSLAHPSLCKGVDQHVLGLQVPHGDSVGIPEEAQLHFVQNLGQELLWQLTIPHQVISFLIGAEVKLEPGSRSQIRKNGGSSLGHNSNSDQVKKSTKSANYDGLKACYGRHG